ncbi:MAG: patatin-like phospholipase family protein [Bacteroidales bacterium]|nr:patatin-like phospholipase family protein [Bacteroidales bacterium]MCF8403416.1 patatin-like phospholipase family protein [Bacteroidales bacterium]
MTANNKKNIALVLSGGGARGLAHIGVIEKLEEEGFKITSLAGTSIGSLIGGVYISGQMPQFKEWLSNKSKLDIIKLMDFAISKSGIIKGEKVFDELKNYLLNENIENLKIPYTAVATNIQKHEEYIFSSGPLIDAIRASVAVPTVLTPFIINDIELVDGGVTNPLPLDIIKRNPGDILVAVDLNGDFDYNPPEAFNSIQEQKKTYDKALKYINDKWSGFFKNGKHKHTGYFDLITQTIFAMQIRLTQASIEKYKPDMLIRISKWACDLFEFHRASEMVEYGRMQADVAIKKMK